METVTEVVKNMAGGDGEVTIKRILGEKELNGKCGLYAQVTIQPGSSLGYHEHKNESETYYILSGTAEYNDNGTPRTPCFKIFPVFGKILEALISLTFQNRLCQRLANLLTLLYLKSSTIYQLIYFISNSHLVNFGMDIIYLPLMVLK